MVLQSTETNDRIKAFALGQGFDIVKVSPSSLAERYDAKFREWMDAGQHGTMDYLPRRLELDRNVNSVLPGVKSVITLGINYFRPESRQPKNDEGWISRYAVTRDYHKVIGAKLKRTCEFIATEFDGISKPYVDTGPILERAYAETGGIGYIGKNTCIITEEFGSWIFLAEILTTLALPVDRNETKIHCGTCRKCIDQCPTGAINDDHTIDARKCISYLTIENRGSIPEYLRPSLGNWIFGCDICQEVCPHNGRAKPVRADNLDQVRIGDRLLSLGTLLAIKTDEEFCALFAGTAIMRAKRRGIVRNACVVAGNSGQRKLLPALRDIAAGDDPMLAEHAGWAIRRLAS